MQNKRFLKRQKFIDSYQQKILNIMILLCLKYFKILVKLQQVSEYCKNPFINLLRVYAVYYDIFETCTLNGIIALHLQYIVVNFSFVHLKNRRYVRSGFNIGHALFLKMHTKTFHFPVLQKSKTSHFLDVY